METKKCNSCDIIKSIAKYSIKTSNKDGYNNICKECKNLSDLLYRRTIDGLITRAYGKQKSTQKTLLSYTKQELKNILISSKEFMLLFKQWEDSQYNNNAYPSITRIDPSALCPL